MPPPNSSIAITELVTKMLPNKSKRGIRNAIVTNTCATSLMMVVTIYFRIINTPDIKNNVGSFDTALMSKTLFGMKRWAIAASVYSSTRPLPTVSRCGSQPPPKTIKLNIHQSHHLSPYQSPRPPFFKDLELAFPVSEIRDLAIFHLDFSGKYA